MATVTRLRNWQQRVYRVAGKQASMGAATALCRENDVTPNPSLMVKYNPSWSKR